MPPPLFHIRFLVKSNMIRNMQQMTINDLKGHWKTRDGVVHVWIDDEAQSVQMFANQQILLSEPLEFQYLQQENMWCVSESLILFMIFPQDNSIMLKYNGKVIEFIK